MKLSNRTYDILKWVALVVIPASATLVLTVGKIWGLPYYDNIGATISAVGLFIAAIIGVSSKDYRRVEQGLLPDRAYRHRRYGIS